MIFITLGSQKFQFNRLLHHLDKLVAENYIKEDLFAQTGYSDYEPQNFPFQKFINKNEFCKYTAECDVFITHAGTGSIIGALKQGKKVIAVPRLAAYGEHVDNHQLQIISQFEKSHLIKACLDLDNLADCINSIRGEVFNQYASNTATVIADIDQYVRSLKK